MLRMMIMMMMLLLMAQRREPLLSLHSHRSDLEPILSVVNIIYYYK